MAELHKHQYEREDVLQRLQLQRLRAITRYAYHNVPYYHRLFREMGVRPDDIKRLEDIRRIPITEKRDLRDHSQDFLARNFKNEDCKRVKSSGSTGEPVQLWMDRNSEHYSQALFWYALYEMGHRWTDKLVKVSGTPRDVSGPYDLIRLLAMINGLRRRTVSIYHTPRRILREIDRRFPYSFYSFPSIIESLADALRDGASLERRPRMIFSHGETLTEEVRKQIESSFERRVYNVYGSIEFQRLAFECEEQRGYHMITDCALMEFIKDGEPVDTGEPGRMVVTSFYHNAMPLIRYNQNDIGTPGERGCSCGRRWPIIESIEGRGDDYITLPSGRKISPRIVSLFHDVPGFKTYKMVQMSRDLMVIYLIPSKDYTRATEEEIVRRIHKGCFGQEMIIEFELVKELPRDPSGKLRKIISKVS